jgi:hypothetical protein
MCSGRPSVTGELYLDMVHSAELRSITLSASSLFVDLAMRQAMMWVVNLNIIKAFDFTNW